jgi:hypothetical protein
VRNSGDGFYRFGEELAREKKGGRGRSLRGLYRGHCRGEGVRVWARGRDRRPRGVRLVQDTGWRKRATLTHGAVMSARWSGASIPIRLGGVAGPRAGFGDWAGMVPLSPFLFSLFLFLFLFLISNLFCIFCKINSNQLKQIPLKFTALF